MIKLPLKIGKISILIILLFLTKLGYTQFTIPDIPKTQTSVYDYASVLSATEKQKLEQKLIHYSDSTSTQIVLITINSLKGEDIGTLTPKWAHQWGIGTAKKDNGVLVLLAKNDRKIWISSGYGLEHKLTAGITGEIIRNVIIPQFKQNKYYTGLDKGTTAIFEVIKGTYKGKRKTEKEGSIFPLIIFIIIVLLFLLLVSKSNKNNNGGNSGKFSGPDLMDIIILSRMGRSSGGFGSGSFGSGGGFGSGGFGGGFGGGGFSGGGAGGSW